jgi:hypothetical protein
MDIRGKQRTRKIACSTTEWTTCTSSEVRWGRRESDEHREEEYATPDAEEDLAGGRRHMVAEAAACISVPGDRPPNRQQCSDPVRSVQTGRTAR